MLPPGIMGFFVGKLMGLMYIFVSFFPLHKRLLYSLVLRMRILHARPILPYCTKGSAQISSQNCFQINNIINEIFEQDKNYAHSYI